MRTGEVAKILGVSDGLVRRLTREGAIGNVPTLRCGQRRYTDAHVQKLRVILYGTTS
jgi:excisionase family DNA binding protein